MVEVSDRLRKTTHSSHDEHSKMMQETTTAQSAPRSRRRRVQSPTYTASATPTSDDSYFTKYCGYRYSTVFSDRSHMRYGNASPRHTHSAANEVANRAQTMQQCGGVSTSGLLKGKLEGKEWACVALVVCAAYMLDGYYAELVCTLLTSVPAAIFTYQVLVSPNTTHEGYKSILFYWAVHGGATLIDPIFNQAFGYQLIKFTLMAVLFGQAAHCNPGVFARMRRNANTQSPSGEKTAQTRGPIQFGDETPIRYTYHRMNAGAQNYNHMDEASLHIPYTCFSEDARSSREWPPTEDEMGASTALDMLSPVNFETTQSEDSFSTSESSDDEDNNASKAESEIEQMVNAFGSPSCDPNPPRTFGNITRIVTPYQDATADTMIELGIGDLVTSPFSEIDMTDGSREKYVHVTNVTDKPLMWALKSNSDGRVQARPKNGVLTVGQEVVVRRDDSSYGQHGDVMPSSDKLAIDYLYVASRVATFDSAFYTAAGKKRHLLTINYK